MMNVILDDAVHKLRRAGNHIAHLDAWINGRLNANYYRLTVEPDQGNRLKYKFQSLHDLNRDAEVILGDAIGNLRSSLDYIVGGLVYSITGDRKNTGFPFANDAKGFTGEVRAQRCFGSAPTSIQDAIINKVQAYEGGAGESLWILNQLRNIDKHRLLLTTQRIAGLTFSFRDRNGNVYKDCSFNIGEGDDTTAISAPMDHIEITDQPRPTFNVIIEEPPFAERLEALSFLQTCANQIQNVLTVVRSSNG